MMRMRTWLTMLSALALCGCGTITPQAVVSHVVPQIEEAAGVPLPEIEWDKIRDKSYRSNLADQFREWWSLTPWADVEEPAGSVAATGPALPLAQPPAGTSLDLLWKPDSETRPGAALLFHKSLGEVKDVTINGEDETHENRGPTNGDRWTVFLKRRGSKYGSDITVRARPYTGHLAEWRIADGGRRYDPAKGQWVEQAQPGLAVTELWTTDKQGFFSVAVHNGDLYSGEYAARGRVRNASGTVYDLNGGESVYRMLSAGGSLWTVTESNGGLYRDGRQILNANKWGFGLVEHGGYVYSTHSNPRTRIFRTRISDGAVEECSVDTDAHCTARSICVLNGVLYAPGFDYGKEVGGWFRSTGGRNFKWTEQLANVRFLDSCSWNGRVWLAASPYKGGSRIHPASVYSTSGEGVREELRTTSTRVGMCITPYRDGLAFGTLVNWRATSGQGELWTMDAGGQWGLLWKAPEPELTRLVEHDGVLYAVTRKENGHGKVYAVK
jgi:hypothetical protein